MLSAKPTMGGLMRRLVRYLAPYKLQVAVSAVAIV